MRQGHILLYEASYIGTLYTRHNYRGTCTVSRSFAGATVSADKSAYLSAVAPDDSNSHVEIKIS